MSALRGSPALPKYSHRQCLKQVFAHCLEEHLPDATVVCSNPDCWKESELNQYRCGVNVMLGSEVHDSTADVINSSQRMFDQLDSIGSMTTQQKSGCQGACFGIHKRTMEIIIEVYAVRCEGATEMLDKCMCNIESLIAQKQCLFKIIERLTFTSSETPTNRSDGQDRVVYTAMRYEAEYTFNPATCQFVVPQCR